MDSRQKIRQKVRGQRRSLTSHQRENFSEQLALHFINTKLFKNAGRIAFYLSNDGELDPLPLLAAAESTGKCCYLPVLQAPYVNRLMFARYKLGDPLACNRFGIGEPVVAARDRLNARQLDLLLMPLVAFDRNGNRIGMGGGYYDRTLAFLKWRTMWKKPVLVGLAYGFQEQKKIKYSSWDVPLHFIATENELLKVDT